MTKRLCVFCEQPNKISSEHLFAEWTGRLIGAGNMNHQFTVGKNEPKKWKTGGLTQTVTGPCKPCNETWMSAMETDVSPVLGPMIVESAATALGRSSQALLAGWATKTAIVAEFLRPADAPAPYYSPEERRWMMNVGTPPADTWVWLAHRAHGTYCDVLFEHFGFMVDGTVVPACLVTLAVGAVVFQVFSYRRALAETDYVRFRNGPWDATLLRIWPEEHPTLFWPPPATLTVAVWPIFQDRVVALANKPRAR